MLHISIGLNKIMGKVVNILKNCDYRQSANDIYNQSSELVYQIKHLLFLVSSSNF